MTFEEHLERCRRPDGTYDLAAAETARAEELAREPGEVARLAGKAAKQERARWEARETDHLRKMFVQPALSPELELDVMVPLGESTTARLGDMTHDRIRLRRDMRTRIHLDENAAYAVEITHWMQTELLLEDGETISEAIRRGFSAA